MQNSLLPSLCYSMENISSIKVKFILQPWLKNMTLLHWFLRLAFVLFRVSNSLTLSGWQKNTYISTSSLILPRLFINCYKKSTFLGKCSSDLDELLSIHSCHSGASFHCTLMLDPRLLHFYTFLFPRVRVCVCFA